MRRSDARDLCCPPTPSASVMALLWSQVEKFMSLMHLRLELEGDTAQADRSLVSEDPALTRPVKTTSDSERVNPLRAYGRIPSMNLETDEKAWEGDGAAIPGTPGKVASPYHGNPFELTGGEGEDEDETEVTTWKGDEMPDDDVLLRRTIRGNPFELPASAKSDKGGFAEGQSGNPWNGPDTFETSRPTPLPSSGGTGTFFPKETPPSQPRVAWTNGGPSPLGATHPPPHSSTSTRSGAGLPFGSLNATWSPSHPPRGATARTPALPPRPVLARTPGVQSMLNLDQPMGSSRAGSTLGGSGYDLLGRSSSAKVAKGVPRRSCSSVPSGGTPRKFNPFDSPDSVDTPGSAAARLPPGTVGKVRHQYASRKPEAFSVRRFSVGAIPFRRRLRGMPSPTALGTIDRRHRYWLRLILGVVLDSPATRKCDEERRWYACLSVTPRVIRPGQCP